MAHFGGIEGAAIGAGIPLALEAAPHLGRFLYRNQIDPAVQALISTS